MKSRSDILNSRKAALLGGAMLVAIFPASGAMAADQMPVKSAAVEAASGWYWNGFMEAGSNIFIQKPGDGWGRNPAADPWWFTPSTTNSNAKMDEYGKVPRNVFLSTFGINAGSRDGRYGLDFYADNVGMDNQRYSLSIYESGRQYFNIGWDQTPHLLGYGKSIFGGVGTTNLTVDAATRTYLQSHSVLAVQSQHNRNCIDDYINGRSVEPGCGAVPNGGVAPMNNIELKTLREKFNVGYRNTMLSNWDFAVDYSHEHRTGTRPLGIGYGVSTTSANPRASSGAIEVPQPLDDKTQIVNGSGEYTGTTPWGTRWNTSVKYMGSYYSNNNKVLDVQNPFCITCNGSGVGAAPFGPNMLRYGLYADNHVNGVTWNTAVNIPIFKTRYTSNVQYMAFRQNDPFIDTATNGATYGALATQIRPYPAASLNGEVNAFLSNNVLYSHLTHDLTNTAKVRYYDRKDNTPTIAFANYHNSDTGIGTAQPLTRNPHSYTQLGIEDMLKWQANRAWAFGAGYFFERFTFENGEVDATNENGVKGFVNWTPYSWLTARSSLQYSQRRYNTWLAASGTDPAADAMRFYFVANRDRTKSNTVVELQVSRNVTVSPNGGLRWDNYPADRVLNALAQAANSLGTQYDRAWNIGTDLGIRWTPDLRTTFGYNYEEHYLNMVTCCGGAAGGYTEANKWSSTITQRYNTFMAAADWKAIPGKLDIKADYVAAISNEANATTPCTSGLSNCTGNNSAGVTNPFPDEHNIFQRFSLTAKYYFDPAVVKQSGFGEVALKARYIWEQNKNTNWATDNFSPYSPSAADAGGTDISSGGRSLFLAYANPNYTAQILALSLVAKW
jgi:MtrB/PioB family decaheme-associated outer membrane protein